MAWVLTRGLTTVRTEFNTVFRRRLKHSDGTKGNAAHETTISGHNPDRTGRAEYKDGDSLDEVRAIDVDKDLEPGSDVDWMEMVVQYLVRKARAGGYIPFRYIIYKRRIWARTDGWRTRTYTGANSHNEHAHFSGDFTQKADNWTGSLGLASLRQENDMDVGQATMLHFINYRMAGLLANSPTITIPKYGNMTSAFVHENSLAIKMASIENRLTMLEALVNAVDEEVLEKLGSAELTSQQIVDVLRPVLGDRAVEVGQLLAAGRTL